MKKMLFIGAILMGLILTINPAFAAGELNIFNWAGYTPPDLVKKFEKATGIKVTIDTFENNEQLLAKLKAGSTDYDIIVFGHAMTPIFIQEKLIQKIGLKDLPNFKNLDKKFVKPPYDPEGDYCMPYQWGTTAFAIDTAVVKEPVDSWKFLYEPPEKYVGKIGTFKSALDLMHLTKLYLGIPLCSENPKDYQKVLDVLLKQKPAVKLYGGGASLRELMSSGEIAMTSNYSGQVLRTRRANPTVKYIYPKEGVIGWVDVLAIPAKAGNLESARKFANFLMDPENAGKLSNHAGYLNGVVGSMKYMKESLVKAPECNIPAGTKVVFDISCSEKANDLETKVMTRLLQ